MITQAAGEGGTLVSIRAGALPSVARPRGYRPRCWGCPGVPRTTARHRTAPASPYYIQWSSNLFSPNAINGIARVIPETRRCGAWPRVIVVLQLRPPPPPSPGSLGARCGSPPGAQTQPEKSGVGGKGSGAEHLGSPRPAWLLLPRAWGGSQHSMPPGSWGRLFLGHGPEQGHPNCT